MTGGRLDLTPRVTGLEGADRRGVLAAPVPSDGQSLSSVKFRVVVAPFVIRTVVTVGW